MLFPKMGRREQLDYRQLAAKRYVVDPCCPELFPPDAGLADDGLDFVGHLATVIGRFEPTGRLMLKYDEHVVGDLDMKFLHEGRPPVVRKAEPRAGA